MNRIPKYKAFYKEGYGSYMVYDLTPNTWGKKIPSNSEECMIFLEFTGIQDKNKKDIYEGDVLFDGVTTYKVEMNQQNGIWCMNPLKSLAEKDWFIVHLNYNKLGNGYYHRADLEIIGNVFENPELL